MSALLDAILGFGSGVLDVADMPGSYLRGLLGGRPGDRLSGREMLNEWGVTGEENDQSNWFEPADIAGTAAGMVFDPLNVLGFGFAGKAASGAKAARLANEGIAAQNAGIESANALSQAMRAKGALPEELLPQAERLYEYIPDGSWINQVPGPIDTPAGLYGIPRDIEGVLKERKALLPRGADPATADAPMRFNPHLRKMDDDQLLDVQDALNAYHDYKKWPNEFSHAAHAADDLANKLLNPGEMSSFDLTDIDRISGDFRGRINRLYQSNLGRIQGDQLSVTGHEVGDIAHDVYDDILKNPSDPMHRYAKAEQDIGNIGRGLIGEIRRGMAPMPEAYQSYYAIPGTKYIDRELEQALTSDAFPATLLESLEKSVNPNSSFGVGSDYFNKNIQGVRGFLGDEKTERLISQLQSGREIPGSYADAFAGGQMYLPYVAPKLQETLPYQSVPKMPSRLLAALLAYNTAQGAY